MIKVKEVIDFIKKEEEVFEKLEEEISEISVVNEGIKKNTGYYPYFYINRQAPNLYKVKHKGDSVVIKSIESIFFDILLNGYNTVKSGKKFKLNDKQNDQEFKKLNLSTKQEKIQYLATLYTIVFSNRYTKTIESFNFDDFLLENKILIFMIDKSQISKFLQKDIFLNDNGTNGKIDKRSTARTLRRRNYITANKIISETKSLRKKMDKLDAHGSEEIKYEEIKSLVKDGKIFPQNTQAELLKIIDKAQISDFVGNISNEFSQKVAIRSLPEKLNETFYTRYVKTIKNNHENKKMNKEELRFVASKILVEKYGYKKMKNLGYASWASVDKLMNVDFSQNKLYRKLSELDTDFISAYINKYLLKRDKNVKHNIINIAYALVMISKQTEQRAQDIIKNTINSFNKFAWHIDQTNQTNIINLYNYEDIQNKKLMQELNKSLSQYLFKIDSIKYMAFTKETRGLMAQNYLNTVSLNKTVYKNTVVPKEYEEPQRDAQYEDIFKDIAEIFEFVRT